MARVTLLKPKRFGDARGWFAETFNQRDFERVDADVRFVQDNHSLSREPYVLRGLHYQNPPFAQAKLVRCVAGAILDVVVDIRAGSPTFGHYVTAEISAENGAQIYVPVGYAHGFLTLKPDTQVTYKVSNYYAPEHERAVAWNDPQIGVRWPLPAGAAAVLSDKDQKAPLLRDVNSPFAYDGEPFELVKL